MNIDHKTVASYKAGCRCDVCRKHNADYHRDYTEKNKHRINAQRRERLKDPEYAQKLNAKRRNYTANNEEQKQKARDRAKAWALANHDYYLERQRGYSKADSTKRVGRVKVWKHEHVTRSRALAVESEHRRRARMEGGDVESCTTLIAEWRSKSVFTCYHCGRRFAIGRLHVDHYIPLAKGGSHTPENLVQSCDSCNLSKGSNLPSN